MSCSSHWKNPLIHFQVEEATKTCFSKKGVPHLFSKFLKNTHLEINFFKLLSYSLENWKFFFLEFFKDFDYKFKFRTAIS